MSGLGSRLGGSLGLSSDDVGDDGSTLLGWERTCASMISAGDGGGGDDVSPLSNLSILSCDLGLWSIRGRPGLPLVCGTQSRPRRTHRSHGCTLVHPIYGKEW